MIPRSAPHNLRRFWRDIRGSVSMVVVTVCTAFFLALKILDIAHVVSWERSVSLLGLSYYGVVGHARIYQFLTAVFLHGSVTHLAFNMLTLWMLGPDVETMLGRVRYVAFSVVCAMSAWLGFLLLDHGAGTIVFGYSGVIFGILTAQATFHPSRRVFIYAFFPVKMRYAVLIFGAVEAYFALTTPGSAVAHSAHLFGILGAWIYVAAFRRRMNRRSGRQTPRKRLQKLKSVEFRNDPDLPVASAGMRAIISGEIPVRSLDPTAPRVCRVVIRSGSLTGWHFDLGNDELTIGRSPDNKVVLADDTRASRVHALIVPGPGNGYTIVDRGSRNGVAVNGKDTRRAVLQSGDRILIGDTELTFEVI